MKFVPYIIFALAALTAIGFAAFPVWRIAESRKARALLAGAVALFVLGIGIGIYTMVGQPRLALRDAHGDDAASLEALVKGGNVNSLAPLLIQRIHKNPDDEQSWVYLAQIYIGAQDAASAAGALGHAVQIARRQKRETPELDTSYGEMLVSASGGQVPPAAEAAFTTALATDPANAPARYYLGMARAQKGDRDGAQRLWKSLLDDVPATSPLHQRLVDMLASLGSATPDVRGAGGAPDINAMVSGLAARLKANPADPAGWQRLIKAYAVLGETEKARAALATARTSAGADKAALDAEAKELKLE